jgi:hypothetical protein
MSLVTAYELHTGYGFGNALEAHGAAVTIVDSATNPWFAMGVGYSYGHLGGERISSGGTVLTTEREAHQIRGAVSTGFRGDLVGVFAGVGVRWADIRLADAPDTQPFTLDTGALLTISDNLRIGIVGQNLIHAAPRADMPRLLGVGGSFAMSGFTLAFDTTVDFDTREDTTATYQAGVQYVVADMVPIRTGFISDRVADRNVVTAGVGYWSVAFSLDVGYQHNVAQSDDFWLGLDLKIYVP